MPKVNYKILEWARKTAQLTIDDAVKKLHIQDSHGITAQQKLIELEQGKQEPTRSLIIKMTKVYRRPLLVFYMSAPPKKANRGQDFRTLPIDYSKTDDFLIDTLIRDIRARQSMVRAALEDEEEVKPLNFIGKYKTTDGIDLILKNIREIINFDLNEFRSQSNSADAFSKLRSSVQNAGIYVLLIGNLGSYHTAIDVEIFRGFVLSDDLAPFIIINDQDSHAAWSFTLIHEFVHLLLGQTGISAWKTEIKTEQFCNIVASELLLPSKELDEIPIKYMKSLDDLKLNIFSFARDRNISSSMVAYKLYQKGRIGYNDWISLHVYFREMWIKKKNENREKRRDSEGGPSYYKVKQHRLGIPLIRLVQNMMVSGTLSTSKAGKILGVKAKNVQSLFDTIHRGNFAF